WFWGFTASASPRDSAGNFHWKFSAPSATSYRWGGGSKSLGHWVAVTARGSRADFFSARGGLIIFLEIKVFKRPGIHRQDKIELVQDVGQAGMVGLGFPQGFSANYFQTTFLLLADSRNGEGGLTPGDFHAEHRVAGARRFPQD